MFELRPHAPVRNFNRRYHKHVDKYYGDFRGWKVLSVKIVVTFGPRTVLLYFKLVIQPCVECFLQLEFEHTEIIFFVGLRLWRWSSNIFILIYVFFFYSWLERCEATQWADQGNLLFFLLKLFYVFSTFFQKGRLLIILNLIGLCLT